MLYQRVGGLQNGVGGSIILLELDDFHFGKMLFHVEQVGDLRPAPAVDALIIIAHDAEVAMFLSERLEAAKRSALARKLTQAGRDVLDPAKTKALARRASVQLLDVVDEVETALRQAGVRYHLVGAQSFFDRREVRDFLAYLKAFVNPDDDVSLLRIANVPPRGLSDVTMERLLVASHERNCSVFAAMKNTVIAATFQTKTRRSIERFVEFIERTRRPLCIARHTEQLPAVPPLPKGEGRGNGEVQSNSEYASLATWADAFLREIGYFDELRRSEKSPEAAESRIRNLQELMATLAGVGEPTDAPLDRLQLFLEEIGLDADREEDKENAGDAVTLITIHSCKGLEFPHVYIVGLEDGLLPHARSKLEGTLDEERRLFYVAVTRAMQTLTISHCAARKKYGVPVPCHPSPFLKELPAELVEHADEKGKQAVSTESGKGMFETVRAALE